MNKHNNTIFSISVDHQSISKQSSVKHFGIIIDDINSVGSLKVKKWLHNSPNHVECCSN